MYGSRRGWSGGEDNDNTGYRAVFCGKGALLILVRKIATPVAAKGSIENLGASNQLYCILISIKEISSSCSH